MATSWHVTAWCGLFLLGLGFLLHVIGTATPTWIVGNENGRDFQFQYGLFRVCIYSTCSQLNLDLLEDETVSVLMCIRAFVILGVIFSGIALCSSFYLIINVFCEKRHIHLEIARRATKRISIVTAILSLCSGVFILIGVVVFDAEFYQSRHLGSEIHHYTDRGDSFNLCVAGLVFIVLSGFLLLVFANMKVPDSSRIVSSMPGQIISLSPTDPQNQSTWTASNSRELQQQWEQLRQQKQQLQHQREKLQQRKNLLQQQQQQFQNHLKKLTPEMQQSQQFLWREQQLQKEQQNLQQKDEQLLMRHQQLRQQEEHLLVRQQQLRQQGEQLQQQQVGQQQEPQAQWHHVQSSQVNSLSQPLFTLSPPSYESLQLTPSSGALPTQSPPPSAQSPQSSFQSPLSSVQSPPPFNEHQTPLVEPPPPPYEEI